MVLEAYGTIVEESVLETQANVDPLEPARQVTPRALNGYAAAPNWRLVEGIQGDVTVYHRPDSPVHQPIVPVDTTLADYDEAIAINTTALLVNADCCRTMS